MSDDEFVETVVQRKAVLSALAEQPRHRAELQAELDISKSTCHRIVRSFDDMGLLRRGEDGYALSELGTVVESAVSAFDETVRQARRLQPLLAALGEAPVAYDFDLFADATVTRSRPEDPSPPIHRYLELYRDAEIIRTVDRASFVPPLYLEELFDVAFESDEMRGVVIYPKRVVEKRYEEYEEIHRRVAEEDFPLRYRVFDGCPFGMTIYDREHVGLRAYDDETGALLLFADTDDPEAVAWAEDVYEYFYERSDPLSAHEEFPDWAPDSPIYGELL